MNEKDFKGNEKFTEEIVEEMAKRLLEIHNTCDECTKSSVDKLYECVYECLKISNKALKSYEVYKEERKIEEIERLKAKIKELEE